MDSVLARETRIDMDISFTLLDAPPPGPPSRQTIYIPDEDSTIRFIGYEAIRWRWCLWKLGCALSAGFLALLGHWFPRLWLRWVAHEKAFISSDNGFIVVEVGLACLSKSCLFSHKQVSIQSNYIASYSYSGLSISHIHCISTRCTSGSMH